MEFHNWNKEVKYFLVNEYKLSERPTLRESYRFFRSQIPPRDAAAYLSNVIYYRDLGI